MGEEGWWVLEKVLGVEGSTGTAWAGRACAGVDGEHSVHSRWLPANSGGFLPVHTVPETETCK